MCLEKETQKGDILEDEDTKCDTNLTVFVCICRFMLIVYPLLIMDIANFNAVHTSFHSLNCTNSFFIPSHRKNAIGRIYMKNLTCFHVCDASYIACALLLTLAMSFSVTAKPSAMCVSITSVPKSLIKSRSIS